MIEILEIRNLGDARAVDIILTNNGQSYFYRVGGLPLNGDLQLILDTREADILPLAQASGLTLAELYDGIPKRVIRAMALVILDEINILRQRAGLALRTADQIDNAVKTKLKNLP